MEGPGEFRVSGLEEKLAVKLLVSSEEDKNITASPGGAARLSMQAPGISHVDEGTSRSYTALTPRRNSDLKEFTPPPAPFAALKRQRARGVFKLALEKNSMPMLTTMLLIDSCSCKCSAGLDHALHAAVGHGDPDALEFLLNHGMTEYVNVACSGLQPLHRAVRMLNQEGDRGYIMAQSLLQHRAWPDSRSEDGSTPLHEAAAGPSLAAVALLLKHDANPNIVNALGQSALHVACHRVLFCDEELQSNIVALLLARGSDASLRDRAGLQPVDLVVASFPMVWSQGSGETKVCLQLRRAARWQARRQAFLIRCKGDSIALVAMLPDVIFKTLVRFL
eukprot:TRINITY_DN8786_c0_g2_i1.p1 TRINITY_DN8786_c0_g2~~TRINITY_DN8786_c0_g2_i1.p1  ORF type:complete len:365 (-),score=77.77 TRINITY_DN8786_c0_g2_i1:425-1429(-)